MSRPTLQGSFPGSDIPSTEGFFNFVAIKQAGWWRQQRGEVVKPGFLYPYTRDEVIASKHILNCFRELDHETRYLQPFVKNHEGPMVLYRSVLFRMVDRAETFEAFGGILSPEMAEEWKTFVRKRFGSGMKVFTGAHQTPGLHRYCEAVDSMTRRYEAMWSQIEKRKTLSEVHQYLRTEIPGVSGFFAWQVSADLLEQKVLPFTENEWVYLGPGPMRSLQMIHDRRISQTEGVSYVKRIHDEQGRYFENAPEPMQYPPDIQDFTFKNIEHSLCEYSRYIGFQWGSLGT